MIDNPESPATIFATRPCPVCTSSASRLFYISGQWCLHSCLSCNMVYLNNPPEYARLKDMFEWRMSYADTSRKRREHEKFLHAIQSMLRPIHYRLKPDRLVRLIDHYGMTGRILDLGCGTGKRAIKAFPPAAMLFGIEIGPGPAENADRLFRERGGFVLCGPVLDRLYDIGDALMDGAILYSYLEHESRPLPVLRELVRVLRPNAPVIIKVPNHNSINRRVRGRRWCGYRFPDHVNYFTPSTLTDLLERSGLVVVQSRFMDHFPFNDNLWMVARRQP